MSHHYNPTKKEIEEWLDRKIHEFMTQEYKNPCLTKEQWLDRYLYTEIHEIFFHSFLIKLYEWISKLADVQRRWRPNGSIVWTSKLVQRLEAFEDKITRVIKHQLDHVIGGPRGKYLRSLNTWIKMLLCKNRVIPLP